MSNKKYENMSVEELIETLNNRDNAIKQITEENADLKQSVETLNDLVSETETEKNNQTKFPVITHKKYKYEVVIPSVLHNGKKITEKDLRADEKLVEELLKMESGMLRKVN